MSPCRLSFDPPLLNSASLWASSEEQLQALYTSPHTGAVTTRTALLDGFAHDAAVHQHAFFAASERGPVLGGEARLCNPTALGAAAGHVSSLNTLGYSPHPLAWYASAVERIESAAISARPSSPPKPVIFSVTGSAPQVADCVRLLAARRPARRTLVEVNLSCPNIGGAPPPAYFAEALAAYLAAIAECAAEDRGVPVGLKLPPYTHAAQFATLVGALESCGQPCPVAFLTSTNTLGSCALPDASPPPGGRPADSVLPGLTGGLAGAALHPLALGNVATLRAMLDERPGLAELSIIGVGGVSGPEGYRRMRNAGADAVGLATALGTDGIRVFESILTKNKAQEIDV